MNDLYRMEDKQVETLFSFDEEVLKKALKNIYSKDFHPLTEIEENLFEATWKTINEAADKGFGTRKPDDPDYDFYREIRMNNAVFAAFKVHRAQNDMAALLLDKNGSLKPFEQWVKEAMPIADHQMVHWLRTEYDNGRHTGTPGRGLEAVRKGKGRIADSQMDAFHIHTSGKRPQDFLGDHTSNR